MKLTTAQLLLAGAGLSGLTAALPHRDSPQQRFLNGLALPDKYAGRHRPYTPGHRDKLDRYIDPEQDDLDPLPWRNGRGASVLGPYNRDRSRQSPDLVRPPSTDHGNVANMRWSFADSHTRIEVSMRFMQVLYLSVARFSCLTVAIGRRLDETDHRPRAPHQC